MTSPTASTQPSKAKHRWTFFRAGGFDQVKLETGDDIVNIDQLDQKLWVALACPTVGLEVDSRTLEMIDSDKDLRVRPNELIEAVRFAGRNLKNVETLVNGQSDLPLAAIEDGTDEGRVILGSARQILRNIGKADASCLSVEDVTDKERIFKNTALNGDGIITDVTVEAEELKAIVHDIIATQGEASDLSGKPGVDQARIETFFTEAKAFVEWMAKGESEKTNWPLGEAETAAAVDAIHTVRAKIDDYFGRCRMAAFDSRSLTAANKQEADFLAIAAQDLTLHAAEIASFPLAQIAAAKPLPLTEGLNPAHEAAMASFIEKALTPLLGTQKTLSESQWSALAEKVGPYRVWVAAKPVGKVESLGLDRLQAILALQLPDSDGKLQNPEKLLLDSVLKDKALAPEVQSIEQVERLVRYHRDLALICNNFVNFKDFYDGGTPAVFQCGTLFLDQRECHLCLRVEDMTKHATMAGLAGAYLAYLECSRKGKSEKMTIVAAFTAGDGDNLMVGRNGLFYDRKGLDWDATIVKIVDNPISIRQAFWSPYKKFVRMLEEQVTTRAAAAEAESQTSLQSSAEKAANIDKSKPPVPPKKMDVGTVAALGVAAGAIGTFFTAFVGYTAGVLKLGLLPTIGAILGVILLISMPSVIMAYIKLRKRNLGPILDANGWAVNAKAKINVPFGASLSSVAKLPAGSRRDFSDRYAEKRFPWVTLAIVFFLLYGAYRYYSGSLDKALPQAARSVKVLGKWSPKAIKAQPPASPAASHTTPAAIMPEPVSPTEPPALPTEAPAAAGEATP